MKTRYKYIIGIGVVILIIGLIFIFFGMNKNWVKKIDENSEIELKVTYSPMFEHEVAPEVQIDSSKFNELKKLFQNLICLRSFEGVYRYKGDSYDFEITYQNEKFPMSICIMGKNYIQVMDRNTREYRTYEILTWNFEDKLLEIIGEILPPKVKIESE